MDDIQIYLISELHICKIFKIILIICIYYLLNFKIKFYEKFDSNIFQKSDSNIFDLRINHLKEPFGIGIEENNFSFLTNEKGPFKAFILLDDNQIIQSKMVKLEECHSFSFRKPLDYNKHYKYVVQGSSSINVLEFETTKKLKSPFISPKNEQLESPIFTKVFTINKEIKSARLYITGLGLYQAFINNKRVGNAYLTPGYNDYDNYLRYQTYNITSLLNIENNIEIHMGNGWYKGRIGLAKYNGGEKVFGDKYLLCLEMVIIFKDETSLIISSDKSWKVKSSKEVFNNIYDGEIIDYSLPEKPLEDVIINKKKYNLLPDFGALMVEKDILYPELYTSPKGEKILDFKQNMVGFVRFKGLLKKDQEITMSHGEILENGAFYNENLRTAKQMLKIKGDGEKRIYEPKFTYFGFRYVLIEGLDNINIEDFEGVVIYTNLEKTIKCETDNKKINQLIKNAFWGQRGNFLDVPTDCPQRDERLGWTGDTQVFINTACYNMDSYIFYKKFMRDLRGDQIMYYNGDIPSFSPSLKKQAGLGGAVWADAATIIPWNLYLNYGDKNLLKYFYPMMEDYVNKLIYNDYNQGNQHSVLEGFAYGDWLALDGNSTFGATDKEFIKLVYYYHSIELISLVAKELRYIIKYKKYNNLKDEIYNAIIKNYFSEEGKLNLNTQTSYALCLHYKIYKNKTFIINDFKERIKNDSYHVKTGFVGSPLILLTLFDNGMEDIAYRMLFNENFPGWLYAVNLGATTIWERWNSILENGELNNPDMNSFNHYAYGSVCEAIYSRIVGLRNIAPGWKKALIKPQINYRMKSLNFSYYSINGKYEISWKLKGKHFYMNVSIPYGTAADIILPDGFNHSIKEGSHSFECQLNKEIYSPFSIESPIIDIINNPKTSIIIKELLPEMFKDAKKNNNEIEKYNIREANKLLNYNYNNYIISKCNERLTQIIA